MKISPELLAQLFDYSLWASLKVLDAVEKLPPGTIEENRGSSFGGILATLTHMFQADRVWWRRFNGEPHATLNPGEVFSTAQLRQEWTSVMTQFSAWLRAQEAASLEERLFWRNLKGEDKDELKYKILLHVANHGTYHRGQVITMIRQAGGEVVSTDLVYYPGI